ncbi:MAG: CheY-like chemotaxis protein [Thermoproteota archaeon]|jgi:CheY-like chemotaxis protein
MNEKEKKKKFEDFLLKNEVLIVDKSSASRRRLAKTISELGAKMVNIHMSSNYEEACTIMADRKPRLVLSDYSVTGGSGFDLFTFVRQELAEGGDATLILVTSNSSQSAVAKAAEEDVDAFIIKPYTVETLSAGITNAFISKNFPSKYILKIEEGKLKLVEQSYEEALALFTEASKLNKSPSLALFYIGQTKTMMEERDAAKGKFQEGLTFNNIHYKCQVGLFDLFYDEKKYPEAYEIVKTIAKYFPANPDRLHTIVRLAVRTENYSDMEYYYEIFTALDMRSDETIDYICAGLYVAGKYLFSIDDTEKAVEFYKKISISSDGKTKFLRAMIEVLVSNGIADAAQDVMSRYQDSDKNTDDFFISKFLVLSISAPTDEFLQEGINLFNKGINNYTAYCEFLKGLKEKGFADKFDEYFIKATKAYPDKICDLESLK